MCIRINIFSFKIKTANSKKQKKGNKTRQNANESKKEKGKSVENPTGYDDIVCEFDLRAFNVLARVVNFSWLFI